MRIGVLGACVLMAVAAARPAPSQVVRGHVMDDGTGQPIAGAQVEMLRGGRPAARGAVTDSTGGFTLGPARPGTVQLRAARLGYATATTPDVHLPADDTVRVVVRLRAGTVLLAPLEVVGRPRRASHSPRLSEAFERMERGVGGRFITSAQIRERNAMRLTDVITSQGVVVSGRSVWMSRRNCPPAVVVDGVLAASPGGRSSDDRYYDAINLVPTSAVEMVEVYPGPAGMPPEWVHIGRCGAILIWSRRGPPPAEPSSSSP